MSTPDLLKALDKLRNTMINVSTDGPRIGTVNTEYRELFAKVDKAFRDRGIKNPLPYGDLWDWHGRWTSGDMPTYKSRRAFVSECFASVINQIRTGLVDDCEATGWPLVDRTVGAIRDQLASSSAEEEYQAIGLLCREALISLAQAVYVSERHPSLDGTTPSPTDAKRMLEAYFAVELKSSSDDLRKHGRSAFDLANNTQHKRTTSFRDAAICVEATTSVVNIVAIVSGRRDPQ